MQPCYQPPYVSTDSASSYSAVGGSSDHTAVSYEASNGYTWSHNQPHSNYGSSSSHQHLSSSTTSSSSFYDRSHPQPYGVPQQSMGSALSSSSSSRSFHTHGAQDSQLSQHKAQLHAHGHVQGGGTDPLMSMGYVHEHNAFGNSTHAYSDSALALRDYSGDYSNGTHSNSGRSHSSHNDNHRSHSLNHSYNHSQFHASTSPWSTQQGGASAAQGRNAHSVENLQQYSQQSLGPQLSHFPSTEVGGPVGGSMILVCNLCFYENHSGIFVATVFRFSL